jgi:hypothetical protein
MVFNNSDSSELNQMLEFLTQLAADKDDERWEIFASFYMSVNINMDVSFTDAGSSMMDIGILKHLVGDIPESIKDK